MKRTIQKLPESELDIMLVLWKQKSDMSRSESHAPFWKRSFQKGACFMSIISCFTPHNIFSGASAYL